MEVGRTPRLLTAWPSTAPSGNEMCVPARGFPVGRRCRLTIIDNHQPSRHGHLTAGAVIASAGLRPLVPYRCRRRSGPFSKRSPLPQPAAFFVPAPQGIGPGLHPDCGLGQISNTGETRRPHWRRIGPSGSAHAANPQPREPLPDEVLPRRNGDAEPRPGKAGFGKLRTYKF